MAYSQYDFQQQQDKYGKKAEYATAKVLQVLMNMVIAALKVVGQVVISIMQMIGLPVGKRDSYY